MTKPALVLMMIALLAVAAPAKVFGQLSIQAMDVAGDSISKGFNAANAPCSNSDQETFNWATSDTHASAFCSAGPENVMSFLERMECDLGGNIFVANPNHASSGARMLSDFVSQANGVRSYLLSQPSGRLAAVFLGHNDNCSGTIAKANASCSSPDLDPANYCKTRPDSFERELRRGLDILLTVPDTRVAVASPVRLSQLCNHGSKSNCQIGGSCQLLWGLVNICGSLTRDCSNTRVIDAYQTVKGYRDIIKRVTLEYAAIPPGGMSPVIMIGGAMVGGATRAPGTTFVHTDAPWFYRFSADRLSCCDCFHPSALGQDTLGRLMKTGLTCSHVNPCCRDTGDPLVDGLCQANERKRTFYAGMF